MTGIKKDRSSNQLFDNSEINGNVVIDGEENVIYNDSTIQITINSRSLPTGSLSELADVDTTTVKPIEGDILIYESGIWKPGTNTTKGVLFEDFETTEGIIVNMLNPYPVSNLYPTLNRTASSIELKWSIGKSNDGVSYNIYNDSFLVGNTTLTSFNIMNLVNNTAYKFTVKVLDLQNQESDGRSIIVKTKDKYSYKNTRMVGNYIEVPTITFTSIELVCLVNPVNDWGNSLIYLMKNVGTELYGEFSGKNWTGIGLFTDLYVDGVKKEKSNALGVIPANQKTTIKVSVDLNNPVTDNITIFANRTFGARMDGNIYEVRIYNKEKWEDEKIVSLYDFSYKPSDNKVIDQFGKNPSLIVHGGTFI